MSYVENIVSAFGGIRPMAAKVGYAVSTVKSWKARGSIPDQHKPIILAEARASNLGLTEKDFFPSEPIETGPKREDAA